jgi:multidrug resistance efflux pump
MLWTLLALLLGSASYVALKRSAARSVAGRAGDVPTARVSRGNLQRILRVSGVIAAQQFAAIVAPRMRGHQGGDLGGSQLVLLKLAPPGSRVKKEEVVAEFDRQWQMQKIEDQHAEVTQDEAATVKRRAELDVLMQAEEQTVRLAKANLDKARLDLQTAEILSAIDAEKLKLAVEEAAAHYRQVQEEIKLMETSQKAEIRGLEITRDRAAIEMKRAQANAEKMLMRAPIDGIAVAQSIWRSGQFGQVQEGDQLWPGQSFLQVVNPTVMVLNAAVNQAESQAFRLGQRAQIRLDAYPGEVWPGRLLSMGAMAGGSVFGFRGGSRELYVKQIPMRFMIEAQDSRIIPDLSSSATVLLGEEKNALLAPRAAMLEEGGALYVRGKRRDGTWEKRRVELGLANDTQAVVRAGLQKGEEVALLPPGA